MRIAILTPNGIAEFDPKTSVIRKIKATASIIK